MFIISDKVTPFLDQVTKGVSAQADILALALVGSYARNAPKETSDVDLVLVALEPGRYLQDQGWVQLKRGDILSRHSDEKLDTRRFC